MAYRAALSRQIRGGRNWSWDSVATGTDTAVGALSDPHTENLGKHLGVGAQYFQSAAGWARWGAGSWAARVVTSRSRATGAGRFPVRGRSRFSPLERRARPVHDLEEYRSWHKPSGPPAARCVSQGMG